MTGSGLTLRESLVHPLYSSGVHFTQETSFIPTGGCNVHLMPQNSDNKRLLTDD